MLNVPHPIQRKVRGRQFMEPLTAARHLFPLRPGYAMIKVRQQPPTIYQLDIRSVQVERFIRRMRLIGEGETRMLIAIEDDEGSTLSVSLPIGRPSQGERLISGKG